jgi:flagellar biosynthesis/type III secretory pathway M-ring protein FliF/YscJ
MSEFFKQILAQIVAIWQRLSLQQKIIIVSLVAFTFLGMAGLMMFAQKNVASANGYKVLYSDLATEEAATITKKLS